MPRLGETVKLGLQLFNGATDKYVRATLRNFDESVTYPTVNLTHVANGLYVANGFVMPNSNTVTCQYAVYDDNGYSVPSVDHTIESETFELDDTQTETNALARATANLAEHDVTQAAIASLELGGGSGSGAGQELIGIVDSSEII